MDALPSSAASVGSPAVATGASARLRALMPAGRSAVISDELLDARIGTGTVASEFDRVIKVRFEGPGPASTRQVVPETTTAVRLLTSDAGPAFRRMLRSTLSVADGAPDNLKSLTLLPDEHAAQAVEALDLMARNGERLGRPIRLSISDDPGTRRADFQRAVDAATSTTTAELLVQAGSNDDGAITIAPDRSRELLASIQAYTPAPEDSLLLVRGRPRRDRTGAELAPPRLSPAEARAERLRDSWDTIVHEAHHSRTPMTVASMRDEPIRIWEEAVSVILARQQRSSAAAAAGAEIRDTALYPFQVPDRAGLGWAPWNPRGRGAAQPPGSAADIASPEAVQARYVDGPEVGRSLLRLAGIDMRTTVGRRRAEDLLQGEPVTRIPARVAQALCEEYGIVASPDQSTALTEAVRTSVQHERGAVLVTELLDRWRPS